MIGMVGLASAMMLASAPAPAAAGAPAIAIQQRRFTVGEVIVTDKDKLVAGWPNSLQTAMSRTSQVKRNQAAFALVIFNGCKPDKAGLCHLVADYEIMGPSGQVFARQAGVQIWPGRKPPPKGQIALAPDGLALQFDDKDAPGRYLIRATVTDKVSAGVLRIERPLTVTP